MLEKFTTGMGLPPAVERRLMQLGFVLEEHKADAIAVTYMPNIRYLTNFSGSSANLFVKEDKIIFITDDRYEEQIKTELYDLPNLEVHITRDVWTHLNETHFLGEEACVVFEADKIPYSEAVEVRNKIRPLKFKPVNDLVEKYTQPKSKMEQANLRLAANLAEKTFDKICSIIKPGMTERELSIEIAYQSRLLGSQGDPFEPRVLSGIRTSMVHGNPSNKKIEKDEIIFLDFGCQINGFLSNICRPLVVGNADDEIKKIYSLLRSAQKAAMDGVTPGLNGKTLDSMARKLITEGGYGDHFQHSVGHGIGLVLIEHPIITFRLTNQIIPENSILTIEPGIYIPNKYGMRIGDEIMVTTSGGIRLSDAPENLIEL